jgi:hypothetical protein
LKEGNFQLLSENESYWQMALQIKEFINANLALFENIMKSPFSDFFMMRDSGF